MVTQVHIPRLQQRALRDMLAERDIQGTRQAMEGTTTAQDRILAETGCAAVNEQGAFTQLAMLQLRLHVQAQILLRKSNKTSGMH